MSKDNKTDTKEDYLKAVSDFHRTFGVPVKSTPVIPEKERCALRLDLFSEELEELEVSMGQRDLNAVADALCDLQYVLTGTVLEFGLGSVFTKLFEEVHRSNMSKACKDSKTAGESKKYYLEEKGIDVRVVPKNGRYILKRKKDGKILKSKHYIPPHLNAILGEDQ